MDEFSKLPRAFLPESVTIQQCKSSIEIQTACDTILVNLADMNPDQNLVLACDIEWEFSTGHTGTGPQKTALITIARPSIVYLMRVFHLTKLPTSLITILNSTRIQKLWKNAGGDLEKLARDFSVQVPQKVQKAQQGVIEIGPLAKSKNVVTHANASLAAITAATLGQNLSKEDRISSWNASELSRDQTIYAALDAWILLSIYDYLHVLPSSGEALKSASQTGQLVSLFCKNQEIAQGVVIQQPRDFIVHRTSPVPMNVSINVTTTRVVIQINKVLVPDFILPLHKETIEEVQANQLSFNVLVTMSSLRSRIEREPATEISSLEPALMDNVAIERPSEDVLRDSKSVSDEEGSASDADENENENQSFAAQPEGHSQLSVTNIHHTRILADAFHEIDKVCRFISKKHTHHVAFAKAFSNTMFITDKTDRLRMEAYLLRNNMPSFDRMRIEKPDWLWKRVRRYIPDKDTLFELLDELFKLWGPIKCTTTGQTLFSSDTWKKSQGVLHDVRMGWLSDPIGIPLYTIRFTDKHGLLVYHCIRGTNSVEGAVHNPIRRNFAALNASVELADSAVADFRHRHNSDVGTLHKTGKEYLGHYDPWLEHEISEKCADIPWAKPPFTSVLSAYSIDPFAFPPTREQFGITCIPGINRLEFDFSGPAPILAEDASLNIMNVYPSTLHLSKLKGKRNDVYSYLAAAQHTKFAVTPLHTKEEYALYTKVVARGGEQWCPQSGKPVFHKLATWWSSQANGINIFYKLPEHLSAHHKQWVESRNKSQALIASEQQRLQHTQHLRSAHHIATLLPPAGRLQPGVMQDLAQINLPANRTTQPSSALIVAEDQFNIPSSSHLVQEALIQRKAKESIQAPSNTTSLPPLNMPIASSSQLAAPLVPQPQFMTQSFTSNMELVERRGRRCGLCLENGRDGLDCRGSNNRKNCNYR